jgi:lambda family phage portal protein
MKQTIIQKFRSKISRWIAPPANGVAPNYRMYAAAKSSRLTTGFGSSGNSSADAEIQTSLRMLRSRSREVIRDAGYAKRARVIVVNNVIGSGMGMQAQVKTSRGDLNQRINGEIEFVWKDWCRATNCHTGGTLHFADIEAFLMGQVFEAGEVIVRKHYRSFGESSIPYALEVIEPERLLDDLQPSAIDPRSRVRMGVEMDAFHRPVAYWLRTIHPGDIRYHAGDIDRIERVPADQIIHLRIVERWPQTRGVPWLHTALRKIYDMDGYTEAEIVRARAQANVVGALKTERPYGEDVKDASGNVIERQVASEPGTYETLYDQEELQQPPITSPNSQADPFLRFLLREFAAGAGPSYESISRDYSQSNYSSSRQGILEDRDLWRIFQSWFIRTFREPVHREWMQQAVLSHSLQGIPIDAYAIDPRKFDAVRFKPRGWSWVDPTKEVAAYKEAEKAGYITKGRIIAQTADGSDHEDMMEERKDELAVQKAKGLVFDTDPGAEQAVKKTKPAKDDDEVPAQGGKKKNGQDD